MTLTVLYLFFLISAAIYDYKTKEIPLWMSFVIPIITWPVFILINKETASNYIINLLLFLLFIVLSVIILLFSNMGGADCIIMTMMCLYGGFVGLYGILFGFISSMPYLLLRKDRKKAYPFVPFLAAGYSLSCFLFIFFYGACL